MKSCVHIYCGDGKGKTTASVGLSLRAAGAGRKVLFTQFFKDGSSSEISILRTLPNIEVLVCPISYGFYRYMDETNRKVASHDYQCLLEKAMERAVQEEIDLLVLDEIISTCNYGVVSEEKLLEFLSHRPEKLEVVLTGRRPSENLKDAADYITEMKKIKHPFDQGIHARKGIEF